MKKWLFNPFEIIAGFTSLFIGLGIILLSSVICYFGKVHLDGVLDLHAGSNVSWTMAFLEGIINWLTITLILFITGLIISKSSIRFIDVAGTQALARFPYLLASLSAFMFPTEKIMHYFEWKFLQKGDAVELGGMDVFLFGIQTLIMLACAIWIIALMYRAYSISSNVKGTRGIISFIVGLLVAEIISKIILTNLYNQFNS